MGECSETSPDAIRGCDWDQIIRGQERAKSHKKRGPNNAAVLKGEKPAAIHRRMVTVYGEKCVSDKSIRKWSAHFRAGRESVGDDQRPGQANTVITSDLIDKVDDLVVISEGVCRLGSEAAHRPAKGTAYGTSTAAFVSVSGRPSFDEVGQNAVCEDPPGSHSEHQD
ncbi:HTH_48 domain-containing protein [Trichonephila clavipes]|nr:HTH_48 domain-containing protein [Trichonephila clavipes]